MTEEGSFTAAIRHSTWYSSAMRSPPAGRRLRP